MIKFFLLLCVSIIFSVNVKADVCYDVTIKVAQKAAEILGSTQEVYEYCSICNEAKPQVISIKEIKVNAGLFVNGQRIDLAHVYYKKNGKYINLGIASGCIKQGEYNIVAQLADLPVINTSPEIKKLQAKKQAQEIFNKCSQLTPGNELITTAEMVEKNRKMNDCLTGAIQKEIEKGFDTEQQVKVLEHLKQIREGVFGIYSDIYTANKYCYGSCGSVTNILPYADEGHILMQILEKLLYLNSAKSGY